MKKCKKEPPIDCDCGDDVGWSNTGYCVHCGGYLPDNPRHKNNWKKTIPNIGLRTSDPQCPTCKKWKEKWDKLQGDEYMETIERLEQELEGVRNAWSNETKGFVKEVEDLRAELAKMARLAKSFVTDAHGSWETQEGEILLELANKSMKADG